MVRSETAVGTPDYISPEVLKSQGGTGELNCNNIFCSLVIRCYLGRCYCFLTWVLVFKRSYLLFPPCNMDKVLYVQEVLANFHICIPTI